MGGYAFNHGAQRVIVGLERQRLRAEIDDAASWFEEPPTMVNEETGIVEEGTTWDAPIHRSVREALDVRFASRFTPLYAMASKAKAFDDRLYACVDRIAHRGAASFVGMFEWMAGLRSCLEPGTAARGLFDAAVHLEGAPLPEDNRARLQARRWMKRLADPKCLAEPLGFYAEAEDLSAIYRHDKLLQCPFESDEPADAVRAAIEGDPALRDAYRAHLQLVRGLTGPLSTHPDAVRPVTTNGSRFRGVLPPSDALESRLIRALFDDAPIPEGFQLGTELVRRIRGGELNTAPREEDGWYAHQFHALAALLGPATAGFEIGPRYREQLDETFQALFVLTRETHVKQLEVPLAGGCPLVISPRVSVEPVPEYYERIALAYAFVRHALDDAFGEHVTRSAELGDGQTIYDALVHMEALFRGAGLACRIELGQPLHPSAADDLAIAVFRRWQARSLEDPDLDIDLRTSVPVYYDEQRERFRLCATLGVETRSLRFEFVERPAVQVLGAGEAPIYEDATHRILSPITLEVDVREPPTRASFRAICDEHRTPEAIGAALRQR